MLKLISGGPKTGKSFYTFEKIKELSKTISQNGKTDESQPIILIVPEQFALEAERNLFNLVGESSFLNIKVTSFTRFTTDIFKELGGITGNQADDCAKIVLMNKAIKSCLPDLQIYKNSAKYPSFATKMISTINELKMSGISYEDLSTDSDILNQETNEYLNFKTKEIASIFRMYEAELSNNDYVDQTDNLAKVSELLRNNLDYIKGKNFFIDEFKGFTKPEFDFFKLIINKAEDVYVSLCIDKYRDQDSLSPFSCIIDTKNELMTLAREAGCKISTPIIIEDFYENRKNTSNELIHIKKNAFSYSPELYEDTNNNVKCVICGNEYDELEYLISTIKYLVSDEKYIYNDIAIITRNMNCYEDIYENLFEKYDVPIFYDKTVSVIDKPLFKFIQNFLNCVIKGITTENILGMLKCELTPYNLSKISEFENYLYIWDIKSSKQFYKEFNLNPNGFKAKFSESEQEELDQLNNIRAFCVDNIKKFKKRIEFANGFEFCTALMDIVVEMGIKEKLEIEINNYRIQNALEEVDTYSRVWEIFNELLVTIGNTIAEAPVNEKNFNELFNLIALTYDMGNIPQTLDCVTLGTADRIRIDNKKVVFVISVNDGEFPATPANNSLFSIKEREILTQSEIPIPKNDIEKIKEERFIAYKALTSPLEKLYLTARTSNAKGEKLIPSNIFDEFIAMFGDDVITNFHDLPVEYFCHNDSTLLKQFLCINEKNNSKADSLETILNQKTTTKNKLDTIKSIKEQKGFEISNKDIALELFGEDMTLSATRIEKYFNCPFLYFCHYAIKARKLEKSQFNPMHAGNIIHDVLENVVKEIDFNADFIEDDMKKNIHKKLEDFVENNFGGIENNTQRFKYLTERIEKPIFNVVKRLYDESNVSKFRPIGYEVAINNNTDVQPFYLYSKNGKIGFTGTIDRIDIFTNDESKQKYIRVIDYKSGKKLFNLNNVYNGINLQMLIYLQTITNNNIPNSPYANSDPAGLFYMSTGFANFIDAEITDKDYTQEYLEQYKMNGLVVDKQEVIDAMETKTKITKFKAGKEKEEMVYKFIPKLEKSLVSPENLTHINNYINQKIINMANNLQDGKINANPIDPKNGKEDSQLPCRYCEYDSICGNAYLSKENRREFFTTTDNELLLEQFKLEYEDIKEKLKNKEEE